MTPIAILTKMEWLASTTGLGCGLAHVDSPEERLHSMNLYTPILVLGAIAAVFAVGSVPPRRGRHRTAFPDPVLPDGDAVHRVRHRDRLPLPVGGCVRQPWTVRAGGDAAVYARGVRGLRVRLAAGRPGMGLEEKLPGGILLSTVEKVAGYVRKGSLWPATFGLACCAIEMMATAGPRFDIARFGMERFSATPRQADLVIVAGRVSQKMAPVLRQVYDQMAEPKWVLSMGVCASSGGMFNNYAIVQGVDHVVPVDIYLPGCPPRPEM